MFNTVLNFISEKLRKYPCIRKTIKWVYQILGWMLSDKKTNSMGKKLVCVSDKKYEHLFGYYDKSPWNSSCTKMIYLRTEDAHKNVAPYKKAQIILKNLLTESEEVIGTTAAWNVQQGCMLQWLGPEMEKEIIYNDYRDFKFCSVILNIETKEERILPIPIYVVDESGTVGLSLDFSRLHRLRPGYGYSNESDRSKQDKCPDKTCIWNLNIKTGEVKNLLTYKELAEFESREEMHEAEHKVNHIMINPNGKRFMVLHRWIKREKKYTRLLTCDIDGKNLYNLLDEDMVSHCNWKDEVTILAWAHTKALGNNYYILKDTTKYKSVYASGKLNRDGHPSYSSDGKYIITDTYPNFKAKQGLYLCKEDGSQVDLIAKIYCSLKYNNETRCDLHPRFSPDGKYICFDGASSKKRQVYVMQIKG